MPKIEKQTTRPKVRAKAGDSIVDTIVPVADLPTTGLKFLVYGPSGTGKTTLACSFPKPLLFVRPEQVEDGSLSIRRVKGVVAPRPLRSPEELDQLCELQRDREEYRTIVLDGVTKFQDLVLQKVVGLKEAPAQLNWGVASQQDWGTVSAELKEHLRRLLRLSDTGCNVVVLGGERALNTGDGENGQASILMPSVMIALTPSSMGWLHEVCDYNVRTFIRRRTETKTVTINGKQREREVPGQGYDYCLKVGPDDLYQTKFRVPKGTELPEVIVDPDYGKIIKYIEGE